VLLYYGYSILLGAAALLIDSRMAKLITLLALGVGTLALLAWLARRTMVPEDRSGSGAPRPGL